MFFRAAKTIDFKINEIGQKQASLITNGATQRTRKRHIDPNHINAQDAQSLIQLLSSTDKTIFYEKDFENFILRQEEYEFNTEPALLLKSQYSNDPDKKCYYLIDAEFHDAKYGVKIYQVKGMFTIKNKKLNFVNTPNLLVKKQFHLDEKSCIRAKNDFEFNVTVKYAQLEDFFLEKNINYSMSYFIMNKIDGVNVKEWLHDSQSFTLAQLLMICFNTINELQLIHDLNIVHRDIKPENIMVDVINKNDVKIKIIDFDMSKWQHENDAGNTPGTQGYVAAEVYRNQHTDFKSDIFSLSIVFAQILGFYYVKDDNNTNDLMFIPHNEARYSVTITSYINQFLCKMSNKNRENRLNSEEVKLELLTLMLKNDIEYLTALNANYFSGLYQTHCQQLTSMLDNKNFKDYLSIIQIVSKTNEYIEKIIPKLPNNEYSKIMYELFFKGIEYYVSLKDIYNFNLISINNLFKTQLNELLIKAYNDNNLPLMKSLLAAGAAFESDHDHSLLNNDKKSVDIIKFMEMHEKLEALNSHDNPARAKYILFLKKLIINDSLSETNTAYVAFMSVDRQANELKIMLQKLFVESNVLIDNAFSKVYLHLIEDKNANIEKIILKTRNEVIFLIATSLIEKGNCHDLNTFMNQFSFLQTYSLPDKSTLLHIAAQYQNKEITTLLIQLGLNPDQKRADDLTPRQIALMQNRDLGTSLINLNCKQ